MEARHTLASTSASAGSRYPRALRAGIIFSVSVISFALLTALLLPPGYLLAAIGDSLQMCLVAIATFLAFQNSTRTHSHVRIFWVLIFLGMALWLSSHVLWFVYEVWLRRPSPDIPVSDVLLFVKLVPFTAAVLLEPHRPHDSRFRAFGLLDVSILMLYSLYLFVFFVSASRLLPGALGMYNFQFNLADAIGNQIFAVVAGIAVLRAEGPWRRVYRINFCGAALYCVFAALSNVAQDLKHYYSGGIYDVLLVAAMTAFICFLLAGRSLLQDYSPVSSLPEDSHKDTHRASFLSSHLAMLVTLSTPAIGFWLLASHSSPAELFSFRLIITLLTIFLLTLLLSIKQEFLTAGLVGSLQRLSDNYTSINRFKGHLLQTEKLTSLGELVAQVANQIKISMTAVRESSSGITTRPDSEPRVQSMAVKIGQYAQRTDALVENMLRFAQETPLQLAALELRPILESALQLSGIAKVPQVRLELHEQSSCPPVRGDSSQLLHVFLQIIANAMDALADSGGGSLDISILHIGSQVSVQFADSGPGIREPEHVFEPFYTTKPVGQGTGLGLSTCYGIIQQHDGEIFCCNRAEGGALFTILLPIALEQPVSHTVSPPVAVEGAS